MQSFPRDRAAVGAAAEALAAAYLQLRGLRLLDRNVRCGGGEIDLIARAGEWLLFVEVRFRSTVRFGAPWESVSGRKGRAVARAARAFLARERHGASCWRCDVIDVTLDPDGEVRIRWLPAAVPLDRP